MNDTTPESQRVLNEIFRKMPVERKWDLMESAFQTAKALAEAGLQQRKPDATREEVIDNWLALTLDPETLKRVREHRRNVGS